MSRRLGMLRFIVEHPVNRRHRAQAIGRWAGWQAWRRVVRRPMTVMFWKGLRARVYPDWPYSWTALYVRLTEYDEMMFTLRYLRPGDAFVDVGANIGFYSLLASSVNGRAPVVAFEPHPLGAERLRENAAINGFDNVRVVQAAAGEAAGSAALTADLADQNRIQTQPALGGASVAVSVVTLDATLADAAIDPAAVAVVKVDTEGFELNVLAGASGLLDAQPGPVWIVELAGFGERYGSDDSAVLKLFHDRGYSVHSYDAATKRMVAFNPPAQGGNAIFARRPDEVAARLGSAASATRAATR